MASSHVAGDVRDAAAKQTRRSIWSGALAGVGLVAFIDETVFHQLLHWHHFYDKSTLAVGLVSDGLFHAGGFIAEIVRSGLQSIDAGQTEAAKSIGMTNRQAILFILLPQSLRRITPPLTNEVITLVKSSSLLSVISISELTRSAQAIIAAKFTPFELYAELAVFYLVIISILAKISEYVERRLA